MRYWKSSREKFYREHPFPEGGFASRIAAQYWCDEIMKIHDDMFRPLPKQNGRWTVEQDVK